MLSKSIVRIILPMLVLAMIVSCGNRSQEQSLQLDPETADTAAPIVAGASVLIMEEDLHLYPPDIRKIHERGKLVVAMYGQDRPPFFYENESGELVGIDVDLALDVAAKFGVDIEFDRSSQSFDEVVNLVARGQADVAISKLSITLSRAKKVQFADPYIVLNQALLINRVQLAAMKQKDVDTLQVINTPQSKLGVRFGTSFIEYAKQIFPQAQIVIYEDQNLMMQDVLEGKITAVLYDENETKKFIYEHPKRSIDLQLALIPHYEDRLAMAVPPGSAQLLSWLNEYLTTHRVDVNLDQLLRKYIAAGGNL